MFTLSCSSSNHLEGCFSQHRHSHILQPAIPVVPEKNITNHFLFLIFSPFAGGKPRSAPEGGVGGGSTEVVAFCRCGSNR